jgi:hypothetical protein
VCICLCACMCICLYVHVCLHEACTSVCTHVQYVTSDGYVPCKLEFMLVFCVLYARICVYITSDRNES